MTKSRNNLPEATSFSVAINLKIPHKLFLYNNWNAREYEELFKHHPYFSSEEVQIYYEIARITMEQAIRCGVSMSKLEVRNVGSIFESTPVFEFTFKFCNLSSLTDFVQSLEEKVKSDTGI